MWFPANLISNPVKSRAIIVANNWAKAGRRIFAVSLASSNLLFLPSLFLSTTNAAQPPLSAFTGNASCSSSGCHGGAGAHQNQSLVWTRQDAHARAAATLSTARSKRIAQQLNISDARMDRACTGCHAPMQGLAAELWQPITKTEFNAHTEAVSCESCHGPAKNWIRSHTRPDLTREQKALDGLHDLNVFYNRANACVACHQVIEPNLLAAGHPELIFELDGQTSSMPRHWQETEPTRVKAWLTGQATALREVTHQVAKQKEAGTISPRTFQQWQSLLWIVSRAQPEHKIAAVGTNALESADRLKELHKLANELALQTSLATFTPADQLAPLRQLTATAPDFAAAPNGDPIAITRAERLVIALQRLSISTEPKRPIPEAELQTAFDLIQSRPDFNPEKFRAFLTTLDSRLSTSK
ncbi:MAG TPA: multiheme c-type cytochrome [Verrucomicrobiae bacterium]